MSGNGTAGSGGTIQNTTGADGTAGTVLVVDRGWIPTDISPDDVYKHL